MADSLDALRAAQEQALQRAGDAWRLFTRAAGVVPVPGGKDAGQYLQQLMDAITLLATTTTGPLRKLAESQRELADRLDRWGDLQGEMADITRGIANQQRVVADVLAQALAPFEMARDNLSGAPKATEEGPGGSQAKDVS
jgi:hypothetical protein